MNAAIVFNPVAGTEGSLRGAQKVDWAAEALRAAGWTVAVMRTRQPGQMSQLAAESLARGAEAVFAAGGDGTVGAVAHALAGTPCVMGVLPIGTANVWATELGLGGRLRLPEDVRRCIADQLEGTVRSVDVGRCGDRNFLLWAGVGLDAHVLSRIEPRPELGKRFGNFYVLTAGLAGALDYRGDLMTLRSESGEVSGTKLLAVITNVRLYAGTQADSMMDPAARADDGQLTLVTMNGKSYFDSLVQLTRYRLGGHLTHPSVQKLIGRAFEIELGRTLLLQLDGEVVGPVDRVSLSVWPLALKVFVPRKPLPIFHESRP